MRKLVITRHTALIPEKDKRLIVGGITYDTLLVDKVVREVLATHVNYQDALREFNQHTTIISKLPNNYTVSEVALEEVVDNYNTNILQITKLSGAKAGKMPEKAYRQFVVGTTEEHASAHIQGTPVVVYGGDYDNNDTSFLDEIKNNSRQAYIVDKAVLDVDAVQLSKLHTGIAVDPRELDRVICHKPYDKSCALIFNSLSEAQQYLKNNCRTELGIERNLEIDGCYVTVDIDFKRLTEYYIQEVYVDTNNKIISRQKVVEITPFESRRNLDVSEGYIGRVISDKFMGKVCTTNLIQKVAEMFKEYCIKKGWVHTDNYDYEITKQRYKFIDGENIGYTIWFENYAFAVFTLKNEQGENVFAGVNYLMHSNREITGYLSDNSPVKQRYTVGNYFKSCFHRAKALYYTDTKYNDYYDGCKIQLLDWGAEIGYSCLGGKPDPKYAINPQTGLGVHSNYLGTVGDKEVWINFTYCDLEFDESDFKLPRYGSSGYEDLFIGVTDIELSYKDKTSV